ncbi:TetR/AcrR family transcriptional regulator [Chryseobacterium sp.]|uniref:TetR/AcrR family transcriptional regulator n=1 Tax=Chryseobacterium sp. TaxID=1871047 RepID=UPI0025BA5CDB|nr:TetR/AcrR family transcriptional regulator [Chryseobacterium sp.]
MLNNSVQHQILEAAKELFFAKGYFNATSKEIADYAKVPRTSINYYFPSVKELYTGIKEYALQDLLEKVIKYFYQRSY